jgi:hypothetical protein
MSWCVAFNEIDFFIGDMFDLVKFVVYYSSGTIRTTPMRAGVSEFQYVKLELLDPQTWRTSQSKEWLAVNFGLAPQTYNVGVHACGRNIVQKNVAYGADKPDLSVGALIRSVRVHGNSPYRLSAQGKESNFA